LGRAFGLFHDALAATAWFDASILALEIFADFGMMIPKPFP